MIRLLLVSCSILFLGTTTTNAQLWKKLKQKAQEKIQKAEDKIVNGIDKTVDKTVDGKEEVEAKKEISLEVDDRNKTYGTASISHSTLYDITSITNLTKTKVNKTGKELKIVGYWNTFGVDVFDGYIISLKNIDDINNIQNRTFSIPNEATLRLDYDALVKGEYDFDQKIRASQQEVKFTSGTITVTFNKDENISISFSGEAKIDNYKVERKEGSGLGGNVPANLSGTIKTTAPTFTITKEFAQPKKQSQNNSELTESDKAYLIEKISPTVEIPDTFVFTQSISLEIIDYRGDSQEINILTGSYPDIYAINAAVKEMEGQGKVLMVMTPKSSVAFMDVAGMKMKKATSLDQVGSQFQASENLPEDGDFEYKKTGNTKTILGYPCNEYKVDYNYTNDKGSASFWVSDEFPIQNKALPMLGMNMNNPNFSGFVLEMNAIHEGKNTIIKVTDITTINTTINSSEYRTMGF